MILALFLYLFGPATAVVDTAVASALEALVGARMNVVHEIEFRSVPRELVRLEANATVRIVDEPRATYRGMVSVPVELISPVGSRRRFVIGLRVRTFESVAVAGVLIGRHQTLSKDRIVMQTIETTQLNASPVTDITSIDGMRTKQIISAGTVITQAVIEPLPLIASGAPVIVRVRKENVLLSIAGTAKKDGWAGSVIPVDVDAIQQHLTATVVDAHTVEVVDK